MEKHDEVFRPDLMSDAELAAAYRLDWDAAWDTECKVPCPRTPDALSTMIVYAVLEDIPSLGAEAGDEIVVRRDHPDFPIVLRRTFTIDRLPETLGGKLSLLWCGRDLAAETIAQHGRPAEARQKQRLRLVR